MLRELPRDLLVYLLDQVVGKADLDTMKCSRLFHARALQREAAGSCHPALIRETLNPHCIAHGGDLKYDRGCSQGCREENCEGAETEGISSPCKMPPKRGLFSGKGVFI